MPPEAPTAVPSLPSTAESRPPIADHRPGGVRFWLGLALGVGVTVGVASFAAREFDWRAAWIAVSHAQPGYLGLALMAMLLNIAFKVVRWGWLLAPQAHSDPGLRMAREGRDGAPGCGVRKPCLRLSHRRHLLAALMLGQLGNVLLPTRLGDVARIAAVCRSQGVAVSLALLTVLAEKALDGVMLLAVLAALLPLIPVPPWLGGTPFALSAMLVVLVVALGLLAAREPLRLRLLAALRLLPLGPLHGWAERAMEALQALHGLGAAQVQLRLWGASVAIWLLAGAVNHFGFAAVGLRLPFTAGLLLAVTEIAGTRAAYAPAAVGVYHSICLLTLALFGVQPAAALSAAILLHLIVYVPILAVGLLSVWFEGLDLRSAERCNGDQS